MRREEVKSKRRQFERMKPAISRVQVMHSKNNMDSDKLFMLQSWNQLLPSEKQDFVDSIYEVIELAKTLGDECASAIELSDKYFGSGDKLTTKRVGELLTEPKNMGYDHRGIFYLRVMLALESVEKELQAQEKRLGISSPNFDEPQKKKKTTLRFADEVDAEDKRDDQAAELNNNKDTGVENIEYQRMVKGVQNAAYSPAERDSGLKRFAKELNKLADKLPEGSMLSELKQNLDKYVTIESDTVALAFAEKKLWPKIDVLTREFDIDIEFKVETLWDQLKSISIVGKLFQAIEFLGSLVMSSPKTEDMKIKDSDLQIQPVDNSVHADAIRSLKDANLKKPAMKVRDNPNKDKEMKLAEKAPKARGPQ